MNTAYDLLPGDLREKLPRLYATENDRDPMVQVKLFTPDSSWTWYVTEFDGDDICFGYVDGFCGEYGYFSLREIQSVRGPLGLPVERDLYFTPCPLSKVRKGVDPDGPESEAGS